MSSYRELMEDFQKRVAELQAKCEHKEVSDWRKPDFLCGIPEIEIKRCENCGKAIAKRTRCWACGEWVEEPNWIQGDGQKAPFGTIFCSQTCKEEYIAARAALGKGKLPYDSQNF